MRYFDILTACEDIAFIQQKKTRCITTENVMIKNTQCPQTFDLTSNIELFRTAITKRKSHSVYTLLIVPASGKMNWLSKFNWLILWCLQSSGWLKIERQFFSHSTMTKQLSTFATLHIFVKQKQPRFLMYWTDIYFVIQNFNKKIRPDRELNVFQ